jgi:hypothetical protein
MMAIVDGDESEVTPTREWIERELVSISSRPDNRFFALLRDADDQWNVLAEPDGFVLEHYRGETNGAHIAYRDHEGLEHMPEKRPSFFASLFGTKPSIKGSRLTSSEALVATERWLLGDRGASGLRWEPLHR